MAVIGMRDWQNLGYLRTGTTRQRQAYAALQHLPVLALLHEFGPVLAGTIPLDIDVAGSDLDLICEVAAADRPRFAALLRQYFSHLPGFHWHETIVRGQESVVCGFWAEGFEWEIFGQAQPARAQYAVRHLNAEYRVLTLGGEAWRRAVRQLKQQGLKTEPAFAQLLRLPGDPYEALLALESWSDAELTARLVAAQQ